MKKLFLISFILWISIFVSCKKETISSPIDTISTGSFTYPARAYMYTQTGNYPYKLVVGAQKGSLGCSVSSPFPISTGIYSELAPTGSPVAGISIVYTAGPRNPPFIYAAYGSVNNPVTVTLTAINRSTVQGSFKGTVRLIGGSSSDTIRIEDAKFYTRFDRSLYFNIF